ncbi:glycerol kinase GlpK [Weissella halotolerans]|uniref:glycerol kinase n=1 Tax=Weissella halotolerans DSM 20190 TaxID=1123500 RepID=A0A0R2FRV3_9LACO|nr:glycerol kinase GlpK [Weissella halotolerans]KRN31219.1 glycerol kinase glpk [Weissella halotolerans DSM 20190]
MAITRPEHILAIDQGTTGTRVVIFNEHARRVTSTSVPLSPIVPHTGWQEQNPLEIWGSTQTAIADALINSGIRASEIKAIGIASQRETTMIWNRKTGQPIYNAISWASTQSQGITSQLIADGYAPIIRERSGLPTSPYFSASKIRFILDHVPGAQADAEAGKLAFGTVDTWLTWQLSAGASHVTDSSNAARTMLFNIHTHDWDPDLLKIFNIPKALLPSIHNSSEVVAETSPLQFFGANIPIASLIGDQNASLVGQLGLERGNVKTTYGSGAFLMMNTGRQLVQSKHNLISTIAYEIDNQPTYALDGAVFSAGSALQWLHDRMDLINNQVDAWHAADASQDHDDIYVVPAFNGLGAPYWDPKARGAVLGLTLANDKNDLIKATLQSIAYSTSDILTTMAADANITPKTLMADGSVSRNPYLMQFQANIANIHIDRAMDEDATALGAAFLAGLAIGYWPDLAAVRHYVLTGRQFEPKWDAKKREHLLAGWHAAIKATQVFGQA